MQLEFAMWEIGWARLLDVLQQLFMGSDCLKRWEIINCNDGKIAAMSGLVLI
jgi:hypothetical protein